MGDRGEDGRRHIRQRAERVVGSRKQSAPQPRTSRHREAFRRAALQLGHEKKI